MKSKQTKNTNFNHATTLINAIPFLIGTSIGFKNIASKIAYDLRLWLGANDPPTKELLYEINDLDTTKPDNDNENEPGTKSSNKGIEQETTILKTWDALYRSIKQESEERSE